MTLRIHLLFLALFISLLSFAQTETADEKCAFTVPTSLSKSENDQITVQIDCPISKFNFKILNRWGQIMYETEVYSFPLDFDIHARVKGKRKKIGPEKFIGNSQYIWILEFRPADKAADQQATGNLLIID